jgi:glycosyltransferase involved in cell wall biosynthesis
VRVGLDLLYLRPGATGGTETYAREIAPRLAALGVELVAFVPHEAADTESAPGARTVVLPARSSQRWQWALAEQLLLPRAARRAGCDVVHGLAGTVPLRGPFARVVTVHDVLFLTHPATTGAVRAAGMRALAGAAVRTADVVLADTARGAEDLRRFLPVRAPVWEIPLGVAAPTAPPLADRAVREMLDLGERQVLLSTSGRLPHKNVLSLLDAVALLEEPRPVLVVTGYPTPHDSALRDRAATLGIEADVRLTGWLDSSALEGLYATATACVVASLAEGFGHPLLEAMVRGVPVAHSGAAALAEVAGDAGLRFDPQVTADMAAALRRVLSDEPLRARLVAAGRDRAAEFTWEATAERTVAAYRHALHARARRR